MAQTRVEEIHVLLSLEDYKLELIRLIRNKHFASEMNDASLVAGNFTDYGIEDFLCELTEEEYRAIIFELNANMAVNSSPNRPQGQTNLSPSNSYESFQDLSGDVSPPKEEKEAIDLEQVDIHSGIPENSDNVDTTVIDGMNGLQTDRQELQPSAGETSSSLTSISPDTDAPRLNEELDTLSSHSSSSMELAETSVFSGNESRSSSPGSLLDDGAASGEETPSESEVNHDDIDRGGSPTDHSGSASANSSSGSASPVPLNVAPVNNLPTANCNVVGRACQPVCRFCQQPMDIQLINIIYQQNIILMGERVSLKQELAELKSQVAHYQSELVTMDRQALSDRHDHENDRCIMFQFHKDLGETRNKITKLEAEIVILENKCKISEEAFQMEATLTNTLTDTLKELESKVKDNTMLMQERLQSVDADHQLEIRNLNETIIEGLVQELETVRENAILQEQAHAAREAEIRSRINCEVQKLKQSFQELLNFAAAHRL